jgi:hypothetical protein
MWYSCNLEESIGVCVTLGASSSQCAGSLGKGKGVSFKGAKRERGKDKKKVGKSKCKKGKSIREVGKVNVAR